MARLEQKRRKKKHDFHFPTAYFQGLNFLLNEQPDKAIEIFVKMLDINPETAETHLALGNLFRRQGEVERAIRIHQNLIARPNLDREQRAHALLELGQDYNKAGLLDRAENLFTELVESRQHREQALKQLMHIYQQEKEWDNAIDSSRKLARATGRPMDKVIAQFYCELAEHNIAAKDYDKARGHIKKALNSDAGCVRASILLGDMEVLEGRHKEAIKAWKRIENQDYHYLGEVADRISDSYRKLKDLKGLSEFFQKALERHNSVCLMLAQADVIKESDSVDAAEDYIVEQLRSMPSVVGLHRLIELNLSQAKDEARQDLLLLEAIIGELRQQYEGYICHRCGFKGKSMHWLCPSCGQWDTVKPVLEN